MNEPKRVLDLFCGAGGAAMGLARAWPTARIIGVDIKPQPRYPFKFVQADAMTFDLDGFDFIWASPPCQDYVRTPGPAPKHGTGYMLPATRERLREKPAWCIENVPGAPMRIDYELCGCMFRLKRLKRIRWFETSWIGHFVRPPCYHPEPVITVTGTGTPTGTWKKYGALKLKDFREVMDIAWMSRLELSQAIPPAYSEYIGKQYLLA